MNRGGSTTDDGYPAAGQGRHRNDWNDSTAPVGDDGAQNGDEWNTWQRDSTDEDAYSRGVEAYWGNDAEYNAVPERPNRPLQWPSQVSRLQREQAAAEEETGPEETWWDDTAEPGLEMPNAGRLAHELPGRIEPQWQNFDADGRELTPWRAFGEPEADQPAPDERGYDQAAQGQHTYDGPEPEPAYGHTEPEPAYGDPSPAYADPQPAYGHAEPAPAYGDVAPAYDDRAPAYDDRATTYGDVASAYGDPPPAYGLAEPPPAYDEPEPQWRGYEEAPADATNFVVDFAPNLRRRLPEPDDAAESDEEEEEEGRRRVPALLIAAIVGVVLLGLGIWARWPRDTSQASAPQRPGVVTSAPIVYDSGFTDSPAPLPPPPSDAPTTGPTSTKRPAGGTTPTTRTTTRSPTPGTTTTTAGPPPPPPTPTPSPTPSPEPSPSPTDSPTPGP